MRERAVHTVLEHRAEHPSQWAAIESIADKIGCVPQTLHTWVKQHEVWAAAGFDDTLLRWKIVDFHRILTHRFHPILIHPGQSLGGLTVWITSWVWTPS